MRIRDGIALAVGIGTLAAATLGIREAGAFCFERAGSRYDIPAGLLAVVAEHESAMDPAARHDNRDGTYDVGLMQINSSWRKRLGAERWEAVCTDPCYNVIVGAWILADCLGRYGYTWEGLGCYNAVNREKRVTYAKALVERMRSKLAQAREASLPE